MANISSTKDILKASYERKPVSAGTLAKQGFTLDPTLSTNDTKVFVDMEGRPNVVFRGTTLTQGLGTAVRDLGTDLMIGLGKTTNRERAAKKTVEAARAKYGQPVKAYGHSLGGKLAESSGAENVVTYNKAVGLRDIGKTIPKSQMDIRTSGDIISLPSLTQKYKGRKKTIVGGGHGLTYLR